MNDAVLFAIVFVGFFVMRIVIATIVFVWILPDDGRCPNCDTLTLRVESSGLLRWLPWLRPSWCYECGWDGWLRSSDRLPSHTDGATPASFRSAQRSHRSS